MSDSTFYEMWVEALQRLARAREEVEEWRDRSNRYEEENTRLRARNRALIRCAGLPDTMRHL